MYSEKTKKQKQDTETWTSGMNIQPMEGILVKVLS